MKRGRRLGLEGLESRDVPAAFGIPWQAPRQITLSIAPDGTPIAGHESGLEAALDGQGDWRRTILTAFQTWAANADVNVAWAEDAGAAFGTPGLPQGDPRFGDVRVGGQAMGGGALAVALPPDPTLSGTWAGDILFNTDARFDGSPYSLLSVALHEAGHSLGLGNSVDPASAMFTHYSTGLTALSSEDVARIQGLYGARRSDAYEGPRGNDVRGRAAAFRQPVGYKGETPLVAFGDVTRDGDVDFYTFSFPADGNDDQVKGEATIRVQTAGVSLMAPKLTVLDSTGRVLARRTSASITGDTLQVSLKGLSTRGAYFVRVEGATDDVFGVGRYAVSVRLDDKGSTPDSTIDELIRSPYAASLSAGDIDAFFRTGGDTLFRYEEGRDLSALPLNAASRGEMAASITKTEDVDLYRVVAPASGAVLTATAWTADGTGFLPRVRILDEAGRDLGAKALVAGNGTWTAQLSGVEPGKAYFVEVSGSPSGAEEKGNYLVSVGFGAIRSELRTFAEGELTQSAPVDESRVMVARAQLFHLVLSAADGPSGSSVRMTVVDELGSVVQALSARAGETVSGGSILLVPGAYTVRFEVENPSDVPLRYRLEGGAESDPLGPVRSDPTLATRYLSPKASSPVPSYTYVGFAVPYDPSGYPGYVRPGAPSTYPPGYVVPTVYADAPWLIVTDDPFYWIALTN